MKALFFSILLAILPAVILASDVNRLTFNYVNDTQPSWSPDGTKIVFTSGEEVNSKLYVMNADGTGLTKIGNFSGAQKMARWSPDGNMIVFSSSHEGNYRIYAMKLDGSELRGLPHQDNAYDYYPSWSPDGGKIAFCSHRDGNWEIYTANADGSDFKRITNNSLQDYRPNWSPDGTEMLTETWIGNNCEILVMNADGSNVRNLTNDSAFDLWASWSSDGTKILFESDRNGNFEIYMMNKDGSQLNNVTLNFAEDRWSDWSFDGKRIVFVSDRDGNREIYKMNLILPETATKLMPLLYSYYLGQIGSKIYKVKDGQIYPIYLDPNSSIPIHPWEAFWIQANDPMTNLTLNFYPAHNIVLPTLPLRYALPVSNKISLVSFPLVKKDTSIRNLFKDTSFDIDTHGNQFRLQKSATGLILTYGPANSDNPAFTVQAGRGYAIQHHLSGSALQVSPIFIKDESILNQPVKLSLSSENYVTGDFKALNMVGNPFDHTLYLQPLNSASNVMIEMDATNIDGPAKVATDKYSDFIASFNSMKRWNINLSLMDNRAQYSDNYNEAGVITSSNNSDRFVDFFNSEDLIFQGDNVRLTFRNPVDTTGPKLCYDYRTGEQDTYTWNIELSTTLQTVDARLSLGNLATIPTDYHIFITDPVTNENIPITRDTDLNLTISQQFPKTLILTASRQKITEVNESSHPVELKIDSIYPNPFNPRTAISFTTNLPGRVAVSVYSSTGQLVEILADTNMSAGSHQLSWDGAGHSSGVYIVRINSGIRTESQRMTLVK